MFRSLAMLVVTGLALGCGGSSSSESRPEKEASEAPPSSPEAPSSETPPTPGQADGQPDDDDETPAPDAATIQQRMQGHFTSVSNIADAIVDGELDTAQEQAEWFLEHRTEAGLPTGWTEHVARMRNDARQVIDAADIEAAAAATGAMLSSCGHCHRALGVQPRFTQEEGRDAIEPSLAQTPAAEMERHQWAVGKLSEGVVGASNEVWQEGVEMLRVPPTCGTAAAADVADRATVHAVARRFATLVQRAQTTRELDAQGILYGNMLSTCAACHQSGC